ncbi:MAG: SDR family NAD(P)-dependent oxidoreductase [Prolixibacteraceae bacterium]|nr:SDR family NAD(P)-dependent oxidoreductase [Prolixibacteraceae bacterium]MBN2772769.1 SDR family NAD(P)-dependent oxidoreductase [Prolixibacteraceae bacterium]
MNDFSNTRVLITGASSGIGKQLAFEFASHNARLILVSRNKVALEEAAGEITGLYPNVSKPVIIPCDVSETESVRNAVKKATELEGKIDVLVNNTGIGVYGPFKNTSLEDFRKVMDVNFMGAVNFTSEVLPNMIRSNNGKIVFTSSVASLYGAPFYSAYSASKAALKSFSQSLRAECRDNGISVLLVSPDYTDTAFFKNEKFTGGARIHDDKPAKVEKVARQIFRDICSGKNETIYSFRGKMLRFSYLFFRSFTENYFRKRALKYTLK